MRPLLFLTIALSVLAPASAADAKLAARLYMASAPANPLYGDALTIGVLVMGVASPVPTGTVTVYWTGGSAGVTLDSTGHGLVSVPLFPAGAVSFSGSYSGDANYLPSPQGLLVTIAPVASVVTVSAPPPQIGQPFAVKAVVSPANWAAVAPTGTVAFNLPGCSAVTLQNGVATCTASFNKLGAATITAAYSGDANVLAGSGSVGVTVGKLAPTAYLAASPSSILYGESVTLTTLLLGATSGPAPSGVVTFTDGASALGTASVAADGRARLTVPLFAAGSHSIAATYAGDANYQPAAAPTIALNVGKVGATLALAATPAQLGQPVTVKAIVTPANYAAVAPTGSVAFNAPGCGSVPLQNGVASCATAFSHQGAFTLTATYSGDSNVSGTTAALALTIGKVAPSVYFVSTPSRPFYADTVTLDALVLPVDGAPPPSGAVTFAAGALSLGAAPVSSDGHAYLAVSSLVAGSHTVTATYPGDAAYQSGSASTTLSIARVITSISVASTPAQLDQPVTLKATVSLINYGSALLEGTISFTVSGMPVPGCANLAARNGSATCPTVFTQLGAVSVTASYTGDANTTPASTATQLSIARAVPSVYAAASPGALSYGVPVSLSALVLGASGVAAPSGSVTFADSGALLGAAPLAVNGRASLSLSTLLRAGSHAITATYSGDTNYATATSDATPLGVARAATSLSLSAMTGGPFAATLSATGATGNVQFLANGTVFASAPLQAGTATLAATCQTGIVTAYYPGDSNFAPSTSPPVTVSEPRALVILTSDHNPAIAGQPVNFTVYVTPNAGSATPTGTISLTADGANLGSAALSAAKAGFAANLLAGAHSIVAAYSGDANYPPATSTLSQTVSKSAATLTLSTSSISVVYGQPLTLTAQLTAPGDEDPAPPIQLWDGAVNIGSISSSAKMGSFLSPSLAAGPHLLSASWAGDATWSATTSNSVAVTVAKAATRTTASATPNALAATVTAVAPGSGTPTGTIRFIDGYSGAILGMTAVSLGAATVSAPASASLIAVYSGDANFLPSNSPVFTLVAVTNAASYAVDAVAPDEIVTIFAGGIAIETISSPTPTDTLGGVSVKISDSAGAVAPGAIFFVSATQAEVRLPATLAKGPATLFLTTSTGATLSAPITVAATAPGLFTADGSGQGVAVGQAIRYHPDGSSDPPVNLTNPIDLAPPGDGVYITVYGTGIRHATTPLTCTLAGRSLAVAYAGAQADFPGLDQINILLPTDLRPGPATLTVAVGGVTSNPALVNVR